MATLFPSEGTAVSKMLTEVSKIATGVSDLLTRLPSEGTALRKLVTEWSKKGTVVYKKP